MATTTTSSSSPSKVIICRAVSELTTRLKDAGQRSKKEWWERYMKHTIQFYGTPMGDIRTNLHEWWNTNEQDEQQNQLKKKASTTSTRDSSNNKSLQHVLQLQQLPTLSWELFRQPIAEQKLCGILILQELVLPEKDILLLDPKRDLPIIATLFDEKHINDWNTTDWLCVKVLGPWIVQQPDIIATPNNSYYETAKQIASWVDDPMASLWRQRASLVSFVNIACDDDDEIDDHDEYDGGNNNKKKKKKTKKKTDDNKMDNTYHPFLLDLQFEIASKLLLTSKYSTERFVQTGIGWVLRERSKVYPNRVVKFAKRHREKLSKEAFNMMTCKLSTRYRSELLGLNTSSTTKKRKKR